MSLFQRYVKDKVVRDIPVADIPELFLRSDFKKDSEVFKGIEKVISDYNINVSTILDTPISELIQDFKLEQNDDKKNFVRMRAVLRKTDFQKRDKIEISFNAMQTLNWDQICQLLEQEIKAKDIDQSEKWYTYFEEEGANGSNLPTMKLETLAKKLDLSDTQKGGLKMLLEKIQPEQPKVQTSNIMKAKGSVGMMSQGGSVTARNVYMGGKPENISDKNSDSESGADWPAGSPGTFPVGR